MPHIIKSNKQDIISSLAFIISLKSIAQKSNDQKDMILLWAP